jgi:hypothetical protein
MQFLLLDELCEERGDCKLPSTARKDVIQAESASYGRVIVAFQVAGAMRLRTTRCVSRRPLKTQQDTR